MNAPGGETAAEIWGKRSGQSGSLGRNPPLYATTANAAKSAHPAATSLLVPAAAPL